MEFDIIIPTAFREYTFLKKVIPYIEKNLSPRYIWIIANGKKSCYIPKAIQRNPHCKIVDENKLINDLTYWRICELIKKHGMSDYRPGWYFQQFLKFAFALSDYCTTEYYLSWDADTIPIRDIPMFSHQNVPYFSMKHEHHQPYFDTIRNLLSMDRVNSHSYIAEHMLFKKEYVEELIHEIYCSEIDGNDWIAKIINAISPSAHCGFSEFETYGTFILNRHPDAYIERELPSLRYGGFIRGRFIDHKILSQMTLDLSVVSFEAYHIPPFPWSVLVNWQMKYLRRKEMLINRFHAILK